MARKKKPEPRVRFHNFEPLVPVGDRRPGKDVHPLDLLAALRLGIRLIAPRRSTLRRRFPDADDFTLDAIEFLRRRRKKESAGAPSPDDDTRQARELIDREGLVQADRFGQKKPHPACQIERDARTQMIQALRALRLDPDALEGS